MAALVAARRVQPSKQDIDKRPRRLACAGVLVAGSRGEDVDEEALQVAREGARVEELVVAEAVGGRPVHRTCRGVKM
jgi:hypothetical protein